MRQVLFFLPTKFLDGLPSWWPDYHVPIYGFGMMLFLAFILCTWLAGRRAQKEGIAKEYLQDLAIWIFVGGLIGARVVFMIQYGEPLDRFFMIWQGGLVFYGSAIGGLIGYGLAYFFVIRKHALSTWKLADIIAPSAALGLGLGRIGCFLNGCCYGNVACPECPQVAFPLSSPARYALVEKGLQTTAGFTIADETGAAEVGAVTAGSPAAQSGLEAHDVIVTANGQRIQSYSDLRSLFLRDWPRGKADLELTVKRGDQEMALAPFVPRTLGLHPTQIYESISMALLFIFLMAYYPLRRHYGEVMILFMIGYALHRFLNEALRNDTDPVAFGMTLSQNGSIVVVIAAIILGIALLRQPSLPRNQVAIAKA